VATQPKWSDFVVPFSNSWRRTSRVHALSGGPNGEYGSRDFSKRDGD